MEGHAVECEREVVTRGQSFGIRPLPPLMGPLNLLGVYFTNFLPRIRTTLVISRSRAHSPCSVSLGTHHTIPPQSMSELPNRFSSKAIPLLPGPPLPLTTPNQQ